ncbi:MAG TPA: glycosyltransferase [Chloroflexi bacterium]|nr:glycosyltransferase [Chloroflexota bacterium]
MDVEDVTVVLPTRNEADNIVPFLASLPPTVALIVVDASRDATPRLIEANRPAHTTLIRSQAHIAEARNIGARAAHTPWLLFTDADVSFAPDYFARLSRYGDEVALYGPKLAQQEFATYYRWFARGQRLLATLGIPAVTGSNLLVRRRVFLAAGGFDPTLPCNEDSELGWRLARQNVCVSFAPDLIVYERDHRRLRRGALRKTIHSLVRCTLLYTDLLPDRWRRADWGYWS